MKSKRKSSKNTFNNEKLPLSEVYFSILQFGFSGYLETAPQTIRELFSAVSGSRRIFNIIGRFVALLVKAIYYPFKYRQHLNYKKLTNKPWLLITSKNNRDVLSILKKRLPESVYLTYEAATSEPEDIVPLMHARIWLCLYRFPFIFKNFYKKYGQKAWWHIDYIFKSVGQYEACCHFIRKHQPAYIVFANDHSIFPRALLLAARSLNVPTIYIQHASVTPYFPPLAFDLSLLEGQATLDRYRQNGPVYGETRLIGMPKFDAFSSLRNTSECVTRVGICCNKMDVAEDVTALMVYLKERLPQITFTFRPHPADTRSFDLPEGVFRSTKEEKIFDFLQRQDLIIAGNTSTHLEAILLNVESIYYEFSPYPPDVSDMYGYHKNQLVEKGNNMQHLTELIENQTQRKDKEVFKKAQYHNSTVGTEYEGKSGELAVGYIKTFING